MLVPVVDELLDMTNEVWNGVEGAASDGLTCEDTEPGFDEVDPGRTLGGEVQGDATVGAKPGLDLLGRVRGGVVDDHVKLPARIGAGHPLEEAQEVRAAVRR